jgi:hypothetical protein
MIYNLILNKSDIMASNSSNGKYVFAIDWTFLPEGKKYIMRWKFQCVGSSARSNNNIRLNTLNFTNTLSYVGGKGEYYGTNQSIGFKYIENSGFTNGLVSAVTCPEYNTPIMFMDRPSDNFLLYLTYTYTITPNNPSFYSDNFIIILSFDDDVE